MPNEHLRTYRLCQMLHCTPSQLDRESAVTLDWLIGIDDVFKEHQAEQNRG